MEFVQVNSVDTHFIFPQEDVVTRIPDDGKTYSDLPVRLNTSDSRAENVGHDIVPDFAGALALRFRERGDRVNLDRKVKSIGHTTTLFGGKMNVWFREGREAMSVVPPLLKRS